MISDLDSPGQAVVLSRVSRAEPTANGICCRFLSPSPSLCYRGEAVQPTSIHQKKSKKREKERKMKKGKEKREVKRQGQYLMRGNAPYIPKQAI
jgi:hypothetical protein